MSRAVGRMCEGKQSYPEARIARAAARRMISSGKTERGNHTQLSAYRCPVCDLYHIGHRPRVNGAVSRRKRRYGE